MPLADLDVGGVARCLAQIADRPGDRAEAFFEISEETSWAPGGSPPALRLRREAGLAVRLVRDGRHWIAATDEISRAAFDNALGRVTRVRPAARVPAPELAAGRPPADDEVEPPRRFVAAVRERVHEHHADFPFELELTRHRRWLRVVGPVLAPEPEREGFWSCVARSPWGRWGGVFASLDDVAGERIAAALLGQFRSRAAPPPAAGRSALVLAPPAASVLLHEAVAHALEADAAAAGGAPPRRGSPLASAAISVVDDPATAPEPVRRVTDDEGVPVSRRWLLRDGVVDAPLADLAAAVDSDELVPGAARRPSRHLPPAPRSSHLELLPGESSEAELLAAAAGGLWVPEAARGRLDARTHRFTLEVAHGRRITGGGLADPVAAFRVSGTLEDLLTRAVGVGSIARAAGAGWCAKSGLKVPVWSTAAVLLLDGVEVHR